MWVNSKYIDLETIAIKILTCIKENEYLPLDQLCEKTGIPLVTAVYAYEPLCRLGYTSTKNGGMSFKITEKGEKELEKHAKISLG